MIQEEKEKENDSCTILSLSESKIVIIIKLKAVGKWVSKGNELRARESLYSLKKKKKNTKWYYSIFLWPELSVIGFYPISVIGIREVGILRRTKTVKLKTTLIPLQFMSIWMKFYARKREKNRVEKVDEWDKRKKKNLKSNGG